MNAILPRHSQSILTTIMAVWRAQPGALMILGRASGPLPKTGSARVAPNVGMIGVFRAQFWQLPDASEHAFLAVVRMPNRADPAEETEMVLRGARTSDRDFRLRLPTACAEAEFGQQVAAAVGPHAAIVARFMLDVMRTKDGSDMRRPYSVVASFLTHAARRDGCVELMLHVPDHCMVLQGWGVPASHPAEIITIRNTVHRFPVQSAEFARTDVPAPSSGTVLVLATEAYEALAGAEMLFLLSGEQLLCRNIVEPRVLDPDASVGQIRHLLPRLIGPDTIHAALRYALRPQFAGKDTLNTSSRPVRAAIDIAVDGATAGTFISGWLFDPTNQVVEVAYCCDRVAVRLNDTWVRVRREDVSAAFQSNTVFPPPLQHDAGFVASTTLDQPVGAAPYLRFCFADGEMAFMPVILASAGSNDVRQRALRGVDMHKPSGIEIVEQHLAPFFSRLPTLPYQTARVVLYGPLDRSHSIVVPLTSNALPRSFLAGFLSDPATSDEQIILVCSSAWDQSNLKRLVDFLSFYDLPATVLALPGAADPSRAVIEAASLTNSNAILLISPAVAGRVQGWRTVLANATAKSAVICPTVLYEDHSIRFAGSTKLVFQNGAPFFRLLAPMAGLAAEYASEAEPTPIENGTFACCAMRRDAIPAMERSTRFVTPSGQEAAFFTEIKAAGLSQTWLPAVCISAPDEEIFDGSIASLVDGWMLRQASRNATCAS